MNTINFSMRLNTIPTPGQKRPGLDFSQLTVGLPGRISFLSPARLALITDAWFPQVNGVVHTLSMVNKHLSDMGYQILVIHPGLFQTFPLPGYKEIRLSLLPSRRLVKMLQAFQPDRIHIATEGTLGQAARRYCLKNDLRFTTAYHTKFPEYINIRTKLPLRAGYAMMRRFHAKAAGVMVATESLREELQRYGFDNLTLWNRGVDVKMFRPDHSVRLPYPEPVMVYVGRVAPEKNLEAFLKLDLPGTKVIVGDGPIRKRLMRQYPQAVFPGYKSGPELAAFYIGAQVMVFPSLTDTFGLVLLEANACGTPVAAFPVTGPRDIIRPGINGVVDWDLKKAIKQALLVDAASCRELALTYSWEVCAEKFSDALVSIHG